MVGYLRLILAALVALAHVDVAFFGYHLGVPAVVIFYVLAGYVVALQWARLSRGHSFLRSALTFYRDRALRLLPAYFAVLAIAACVALLARPETYFLSAGPSFSCVAANLSIVPMNYFQFNGLDRCSLIPVAWSLGLEMQFYLLVPLLIGMPAPLLAIGALSILIFVLAGIGAIPTDMWGYRLLPGTLFIFLVGVLMGTRQEAATARVAQWVPWLVSFAAAIWTIWVYFSAQSQIDFAFETGLGVAIATPLVVLARRVSRSRLDDLAGRFAYPLFLLHFPVLWTLESAGIYASEFSGRLIYLFLCFIFAGVVYFLIDFPVEGIRKRILVRD